MNMHVGNKLLGSFPTILFRKKRLTVAIHAQFDLECAEDVEKLRTRIEETMARLLRRRRERRSPTRCPTSKPSFDIRRPRILTTHCLIDNVLS